MLMALRLEPSRFFLKGKVTQKQTSYKHKQTVREEVILVRCEMNTKEEDRKSRVRLWPCDHTKEIKCE